MSMRENTFQKIVCKMEAIWFRSQYAKDYCYVDSWKQIPVKFQQK